MDISNTALLDRFAADFEPGTVLFREGEEAREMYVIQAGSVAIMRHIGERDRTIAVLPAGEFFGEMAIVNDRPRYATAVVREKARLLVIDSKTFESMLRGKIEVAVRMIKTLAGRLERANQQIELLLLKDANHRVVQCLRQLAEEHGKGAQGAIFIPVGPKELANRVALPEDYVTDIVHRLAMAHLIVRGKDAGLDGEGYVIPEVGNLLEFLEFLELKERFGNV
jgi:CRP-like cAMP-binding protein